MCRDKNASSNTPFNIGKAIELTGFDETEAQPLAAGLVELTDSSQEVLREVLYWTGGQPFLTQKLCKLLLENAELISDLPQGGHGGTAPTFGGEKDKIHTAKEWVEKVVRLKIVDNWESQDVPEHLSTIRDRLFKQNQRIIRRLGLYQ